MKYPDTRGVLCIGLFALAVMIFALMALVPALGQNDLFKILATSVIQGGLLLCVAFYFGSSKGSADKDATVADAVSKMDGPKAS